MSIFDLFGKDRESKNPKNAKDYFDKDGFKISGEEELSPATKTGTPFSVFYPKSFADIATVINELKKGKAAVVHLNDLKPETAIRIVDMLSGAVYALGGGVHEMEKNIFLFSSSDMEIHG